VISFFKITVPYPTLPALYLIISSSIQEAFRLCCWVEESPLVCDNGTV